MSVIFKILGITIFVFILQVIFGIGFTQTFALVPSQIIEQPWGIVTAIFLHGDLNHLFFNMFALIMFGPLLAQAIGNKRFITIYLATGIIASFAALIYYGIIAPNAIVLGASGAIMGMLGVLIMLMPRLPILFFFVIPMPLWVAGVGWFLLDTFGLFNPGGIANIAHIAGMLSGLAFGYYYKKKSKQFKHKFTQHKGPLTQNDVEQYIKYGRI